MKKFVLNSSSTFFMLMLVFIGISFIIKPKTSYLYNTFPVFLVYFVFLYFERKWQAKVGTFIKNLVLLTMLLHATFGQHFNLYQNNAWFDKGLHLFGTFSFSLFCYAILNIAVAINTNSKIFIFIAVSSLGISLGVYLEIIEFSLDIIFGPSHQYGLADTNMDLIFNLIGAYIAGFWAIFFNDSLIYS